METELKIAQDSLNKQFDREVLALKNYLKYITEEDLSDPDKAREAASRIFYAYEGIKKIVNVMQYVNAWQKNGDPPQLSYTN